LNALHQCLVFQGVMWLECIVSFNRFSRFKLHGPYAVGNKVTASIKLFVERAVATIDTKVVFRRCCERAKQRSE